MKILINKSHTYYDQIQMQLTLTTQLWFDFIFCASKGLVIHRLQVDEFHWHKLQTKILNIYFEHMLDELVNSQSYQKVTVEKYSVKTYFISLISSSLNKQSIRGFLVIQ